MNPLPSPPHLSQRQACKSHTFRRKALWICLYQMYVYSRSRSLCLCLCVFLSSFTIWLSWGHRRREEHYEGAEVRHCLEELWPHRQPQFVSWASVHIHMHGCHQCALLGRPSLGCPKRRSESFLSPWGHILPLTLKSQLTCLISTIVFTWGPVGHYLAPQLGLSRQCWLGRKSLKKHGEPVWWTPGLKT